MRDYVAPDSLTAASAAQSTHASIQYPSNAAPISASVAKGVVAVADSVAVLVAGALPLLMIRAGMTPTDRQFGLMSVVFGALVFVNLANWCDAYRFSTLRRASRAAAPAMLAWLATGLAMVTILDVSGMTASPDWRWIVEWLTGELVLLLAIRIGFQYLCGHWSREGRLTRQVAVVGAGPVGERLLRRLGSESGPDLQVVGVYEDRHQRLPDRCAGYPIRGSVDDLVVDIRRQRVDAVIVTLPLTAERRIRQIVEKLRQTPVALELCPEWFDLSVGACPMDRLADVPLLQAAEPPLHDWRGIAKDVEDRILSALILLMISPILLSIAIAIKLDSPGPVFFRQKRHGFNNELIEVLKFRSMYHHKSDANAEQLTRRNDPRVTKLGAFLRKTSLDELPQFINVLRGEMSIVGPRPHALAAKAGGMLYPDAVRSYHARHRMKPGITGWAQVNGWRGETETVDQIVKRVEHDLYYVDNWSVLLDLKIIARTAIGGFTGRQAY
jgi:Undecaprenyl-phosphate glucose phosphotransferase